MDKLKWCKSKEKSDFDDEHLDNFKPVIIPSSELPRLMSQLGNYKDKLTVGQYLQCLNIWDYDPYSAIRYCKVMIDHKKRSIDEDIYE